jgi:DNA polymerase III delta subunit
MARAARPGPVQAILGEDSFLAERALERVLAEAVPGGDPEALQVVYGDEKKWADVLGAARTGSLFVARRAIVVRRADLFVEDRSTGDDGPGGGQGDDGAESAEAGTPGKGVGRRGKRSDRVHPLAAYLADPNPDVTVVLVAARPDKRRQPWKSVLPAKGDPPPGQGRLASDDVHAAQPLRGRELRAFVDGELRRRGLRFTRDAQDELVEEVGQDLRRLMGELDKVEAWGGGQKELSLDELDAVLGKGLGRPLYVLADAFSARDTAASLEFVEDALRDRTDSEKQGPSLKMMATLHRALRQVRAAAALREAGVSGPQIAARLLPPHMQFKLDALVRASKRWSEADLARAIAVLNQTDRRLKTGADPAVSLVSAVVAACGGAATSPRRAP